MVLCDSLFFFPTIIGGGILVPWYSHRGQRAYYVGSRYRTQVVRHGRKHRDPLDHLTIVYNSSTPYFSLVIVLLCL